MGKHTGGQPDEVPSTPRLLRLTAGLLVTFAAWGALVWLAIGFGAQARAGQGTAWGLLLVAGLGAAACLFVALILTARVLAAIGVLGRPRRDRAQAAYSPKRAARSPRTR